MWFRSQTWWAGGCVKGNSKTRVDVESAVQRRCILCSRYVQVSFKRNLWTLLIMCACNCVAIAQKSSKHLTCLLWRACTNKEYFAHFVKITKDFLRLFKRYQMYSLLARLLLTCKWSYYSHDSGPVFFAIFTCNSYWDPDIFQEL